MIFVTTGTQLPFARLIDAMAEIAPHLDERIVAQVGPDTAPRAGLDLHETLTPEAFAQHFQEARVVVAHAGIGSILSAQRYGRPLILMPRRHDLGEHRNDHQMATAREVEGRTGLYIAYDTPGLHSLLRRDDLCPARPGQGQAYDSLIARLHDFITA